MIYFTAGEIFRSMLYGAIYGALCAFLFVLLTVSRLVIRDVALCFRQIFVYKNIRDKIRLEASCDNVCQSSAGVIFEIILFTLGFILLSYLALDGLIRGYMLAIVFASFYLSKMAFFDYFKMIILKVLRFLLVFFTSVLRILLFPFCILCQKVRTKFVKNHLD